MNRMYFMHCRICLLGNLVRWYRVPVKCHAFHNSSILFHQVQDAHSFPLFNHDISSFLTLHFLSFILYFQPM